MTKLLRCETKVGKGQCRRVAGWGSDHYGIGPCKQHDIINRSMGEMLPAPMPNIRALSETFRQDKDPFELREEIALLRAMISQFVDQLDDSSLSLMRAAPALNQLLGTLGKLVQRLHEIEVGRQYVIHVDQVQRSLQQVLAIIIDYVPDATSRAEIADKIGAISIQGVTMPPTTALTRTDQAIVILSQQLSLPKISDPNEEE